MGKEKIYLPSKGEIALYITKKPKKTKNKRKILRILSKKCQKVALLKLFWTHCINSG
jgi:hypothetical protein